MASEVEVASGAMMVVYHGLAVSYQYLFCSSLYCITQNNTTQRNNALHYTAVHFRGTGEGQGE